MGEPDCPFCGNVDTLTHEAVVPTRYRAECQQCGALGPPRSTHEEARAAWNRRAPAAKDGAVEEAATAVAKAIADADSAHWKIWAKTLNQLAPAWDEMNDEAKVRWINAAEPIINSRVDAAVVERQKRISELAIEAMQPTQYSAPDGKQELKRAQARFRDFLSSEARSKGVNHG